MTVNSTIMSSVKEKVQIKFPSGYLLSSGHFLSTFCLGIVIKCKFIEKGAGSRMKETKEENQKHDRGSFCLHFLITIRSKIVLWVIRLRLQSPNSRQIAVVWMQSPVFSIVKTAYEEKVIDSPNSYTDMQPEKEATACEGQKRHMVKRRKEEDSKDLIKKQT